MNFQEFKSYFPKSGKYQNYYEDGTSILVIFELDVFAMMRKAVNAEREACAKICDELAESNRTSPTDSMWQYGECAAAIRARGQA